MAIRFYEQNIKAQLKDKRKLARFIDHLVHSHIPTLKRIHLTYVFCDDSYLLSINKEFLHHDTFTDIITFDMSEKEQEMDAEIYISVDRVKDNAGQFGTNYQQELHRVIFHGALHLCGLKDKSGSEKEAMRKAEDDALRQYYHSLLP